jgi:hypothetical protein
MKDDWDRKPKDAPSIWLKLKTKGEAAKFRIAAAPLREVTVWPAGQGGKPLEDEMVANLTPGQWMSLMRSPDWEVREGYVLLVLDRIDGAARIFRISSSIYGKIRDYAKNPEWGNPTKYDITVTRTEAPGKAYWDVTPSPNKGDLTAAELDKVHALDIHKLLPNALPTNAPQPDEIDENTEPEPLPWERHLTAPKAAKPSAVPADDSIAAVPDGPINLDDIPF